MDCTKSRTCLRESIEMKAANNCRFQAFELVSKSKDKTASRNIMDLQVRVGRFLSSNSIELLNLGIKLEVPWTVRATLSFQNAQAASRPSTVITDSYQRERSRGNYSRLRSPEAALENSESIRNGRRDFRWRDETERRKTCFERALETRISLFRRSTIRGKLLRSPTIPAYHFIQCSLERASGQTSSTTFILTETRK